jgi:hypothetical protein
MEKPKMSHPVEIFENDEASKLLDYFVAYKKMLSKIEYIKCISALNSEVHFSENRTPTENNTLTTIDDNRLPTGLPATFDK